MTRSFAKSNRICAELRYAVAAKSLVLCENAITRLRPRHIEEVQSSAFPFVASLILSGVVISAMRASAQDSAELKKKLTAEQKEIAKVLIACEEKLLALEKWLERSESLTDQQIAKHLKKHISDSAKASAAFEARPTVELLGCGEP